MCRRLYGILLLQDMRSLYGRGVLFVPGTRCGATRFLQVFATLLPVSSSSHVNAKCSCTTRATESEVIPLSMLNRRMRTCIYGGVGLPPGIAAATRFRLDFFLAILPLWIRHHATRSE